MSKFGGVVGCTLLSAPPLMSVDLVCHTTLVFNNKIRPRGLMAKALDFGSLKSNTLEIPGSTPGVVDCFCLFAPCHYCFFKCTMSFQLHAQTEMWRCETYEAYFWVFGFLMQDWGAEGVSLKLELNWTQPCVPAIFQHLPSSFSVKRQNREVMV